MPRYDGTGPQSQGPLTGRGAGRCAGAKDRRFAADGAGRGPGQGGGGRGWRRCFFATGLPGWLRRGQATAPATDRDAEITQLRAQLAAVDARLAALEGRGSSS